MLCLHIHVTDIQRQDPISPQESMVDDGLSPGLKRLPRLVVPAPQRFPTNCEHHPASSEPLLRCENQEGFCLKARQSQGRLRHAWQPSLLESRMKVKAILFETTPP